MTFGGEDKSRNHPQIRLENRTRTCITLTRRILLISCRVAETDRAPDPFHILPFLDTARLRRRAVDGSGTITSCNYYTTFFQNVKLVSAKFLFFSVFFSYSCSNNVHLGRWAGREHPGVPPPRGSRRLIPILPVRLSCRAGCTNCFRRVVF